MNTITGRALLLGCALLLVAGCINQKVKSTSLTQLKVSQEDTPESLLLDVGIVVFDTGLDGEPDSDDFIFPEVRRAEALYMPFLLAEALRNSGAWGAVRMVPDSQQVMDLLVEATIVQSHGEELELKVLAQDATGVTWLKKRYKGNASRYSYQGSTRHDPFQSTYNEIANDLFKALKKRSDKKLADIRLVSELRFARSFSPEAFDGHLSTSRRGRHSIERLPAEDDPMLERVSKIRERDHLFIDTLQDYYASFSGQMQDPYQNWRKQSYEEVMALRELHGKAKRNMILGAVGILAGIAAAGGDHPSTRAAGNVGIIAGAHIMNQALNQRAEAEIHAEALEELGASLETAIAPQVIELEDRTVTLTGNVQDQYNQWRELLRQIYETEVGSPEPTQQDKDV